MQAGLGVCSLEECAARVVATIVSRPSLSLIVIDGGSKTFATDVQPGTKPLNLGGFGCIVGYPSAVLERLYEEHGMLTVREDEELKVADLLEFIPNHICSTVNLHKVIYTESENGVLEEMRVEARGKVQ